ncbi:serine/threonine protein kinase [Chroococcidiopsis cubana CCALA 043]|nr:serine/threonine protein kinase [Chroococcidiopsis cubana CCALA 043]
MSYCFNLTCSHPQNPSNVEFCQSCKSSLLLQQRYRILKPMGQGGMGRTFLVVDESYASKSLCVLKQFLPQFHICDRQQQALARFDREALRLEALGQHPQIPHLLDRFEQDGHQYLVQEFVDGRTLEQEFAEEGAFDESKIRQLLNDLLPVLHFIHSRNIIHQDIKPANVIRRSSDGQLVLVDFSVAKCATGPALGQTETIIGSAEYAAPEQIRGKATFASDLYSLGVTCIHLLIQVPPFDIFDSSEDSWVWRCYLGLPVSDRLGQILARLLQNSTRWRYQLATEVIRDLNAEFLQNPICPTIAASQQSNFAPVLNSKTKVKALNLINSFLTKSPEFSVTVFEPQTRCWYRIQNAGEDSASVQDTALLFQLQTAIPLSDTRTKTAPQVSAVEAKNIRKSSRLFLDLVWLTTIGLAIFTCLSLGIKSHPPAFDLKVELSQICFLPNLQLIQPLLNLK